MQRFNVALLCSTRSPGTIVVRAIELAVVLKDAPVTVVSGFHSPVERECMQLLLRGTVEMVVCPARSARGMRMPTAWRPAVSSGRVTVRSASDERGIGRATKRTTAKLADERNRFVASLSDAVLFLHASPGGKLHRLATELFESSTPVWAVDDPANEHLLKNGARPIVAESVGTIWGMTDGQGDA